MVFEVTIEMSYENTCLSGSLEKENTLIVSQFKVQISSSTMESPTPNDDESINAAL